MGTPTVTATKRWSVAGVTPPLADMIDMIHIYDFDNTLFRSPLPNKQLWSSRALALLHSNNRFIQGGWWQTPGFLDALGDGTDKEEPRAWNGYWNEDVVELVRLSMQQPNALCVLLTGRSECRFGDLVKRMADSKLLRFDLVVLKPGVSPDGHQFRSTQDFKQSFLTALIKTYHKASQVQIYEDRPAHVHQFKSFFTTMNREMLAASSKWAGRKEIATTVTQVPPLSKLLNPVVEIGQVQRLINLHNSAILSGNGPSSATPWKLGRRVQYTGYLVPPKVMVDLQSIVKIPNFVPRDEMRLLAAVIAVRPSSNLSERLQAGAKIRQRWRVLYTCTLDNRVWALQLVPVPTDGHIERLEYWPPRIILALRKGTSDDEVRHIKKWYPPPISHRDFEFDTFLGEKSIIDINEERGDIVVPDDQPASSSRAAATSPIQTGDYAAGPGSDSVMPLKPSRRGGNDYDQDLFPVPSRAIPKPYPSEDQTENQPLRPGQHHEQANHGRGQGHTSPRHYQDGPYDEVEAGYHHQGHHHSHSNSYVQSYNGHGPVRDPGYNQTHRPNYRQNNENQYDGYFGLDNGPPRPPPGSSYYPKRGGRGGPVLNSGPSRTSKRLEDGRISAGLEPYPSPAYRGRAASRGSTTVRRAGGNHYPPHPNPATTHHDSTTISTGINMPSRHSPIEPGRLHSPVQQYGRGGHGGRGHGGSGRGGNSYRGNRAGFNSTSSFQPPGGGSTSAPYTYTDYDRQDGNRSGPGPDIYSSY